MHRVKRKRIVRSKTQDNPEVFERGDEFEPTEAELRAFGDRLEEVSNEPEVSEETFEEPNEGSDVDEILRDAGVDPDDYDSLRSMAKEHDDVDGRLSASKLKTQLAEKLG